MITKILTSRIHFTVCVTICILLAVCGLHLLFGTTTEASGSSEPTYRTVEVCAGDTLWTIARDYMPKDMDLREAVYELKTVNGIKAPTDLVAGQELLIPEN